MEVEVFYPIKLELEDGELIDESNKLLQELEEGEIIDKFRIKSEPLTDEETSEIPHEDEVKTELIVEDSEEKDENNKTIECNLCQRQFTRLDNLRVHERIHTGSKPYPCKQCGKAFRQLAHLKRHRRTHTGQRPYGCEVCLKRFGQKDHLTDHLKIHSGERPHACDVCDKKFIQMQHLKRHRNTHFGEKPHSCGHCKKSFFQMSQLKRHKCKTGVRERPRLIPIENTVCCPCDPKSGFENGRFSCCCGSISLSHLKERMSVCSGDGTYSCDQCSKSFTYLSTMKKHMTLHSSETFSCRLCGENALRWTDLNGHLRAHSK